MGKLLSPDQCLTCQHPEVDAINELLAAWDLARESPDELAGTLTRAEIAAAHGLRSNALREHQHNHMKRCANPSCLSLGKLLPMFGKGAMFTKHARMPDGLETFCYNCRRANHQARRGKREVVSAEWATPSSKIWDFKLGYEAGFARIGRDLGLPPFRESDGHRD